MQSYHSRQSKKAVSSRKSSENMYIGIVQPNLNLFMQQQHLVQVVGCNGFGTTSNTGGSDRVDSSMGVAEVSMPPQVAQDPKTLRGFKVQDKKA